MINEGQKEITELLNSQDREDCLLGIILAMKTQSWAWLRWNLHNKCFQALIPIYEPGATVGEYENIYVYIKGDVYCAVVVGNITVGRKSELRVGQYLPEDHIIELE